MNPADTNHDEFAEVHVPEVCASASSSPYNLGCMINTATNYDPAAKQPGPCTYPTRGCMSQTALNYNPEATDDDGSCIEPVYGCTINDASYYEVDSQTPGFKGLYLHKGTEKVMQGSDWKSVINYDANANAMKAGYTCIVAVEGCTDPNAVNYNSYANINT